MLLIYFNFRLMFIFFLKSPTKVSTCFKSSRPGLDCATIFAAPYISWCIDQCHEHLAGRKVELHERSYPSRDCIFSASLIPQLFLPLPQFVRPYRLLFSSRLLLKNRRKCCTPRYRPHFSYPLVFPSSSLYLFEAKQKRIISTRQRIRT